MTAPSEPGAQSSPPRGLPRYRLLTGPDDRAFCERVSEALAQGWCLYGDPSTGIAADGSTRAAQAVVWPSTAAIRAADALTSVGATSGLPLGGDARFAQAWIDAWNAHDLDAILTHYGQDIVLRSPVAARAVPGSGGVLVGREALRAYWSRGLELLPQLHFDLLATLSTVAGLTLLYRNERDQLVTETMILDRDGLVTEAIVAYGAVPAR